MVLEGTWFGRGHPRCAGARPRGSGAGNADARTAFVRCAQRRRGAHGRGRCGPGGARTSSISPATAATAGTDQSLVGNGGHDFQRIPVPAGSACRIAQRQIGRHGSVGVRGHRGQPGAARERGRTDGVVAAQHWRVSAGSDAPAHPSRHRGSAVGQSGHLVGPSQGWHRGPGLYRFTGGRRRGGGARAGGHSGGRRRRGG